MKRNLSEIKTKVIKINNSNLLKKSLNQSSSEISTISNKQPLINKDAISTFNIESLTTIEDAISYFFDPKITPDPTSFIDFFKTIRYFMFNISLKKLFYKQNSPNTFQIIENLLNLQFLSILLQGIIFPKYKENIRLKNIITNCISSIHQNFLLLCQIIINELNKYSYTNIFINGLTQIILTKLIGRTTSKTKDIFKKIDKKNKEILINLKSIINVNKTITQLPKGLSPLSLVIKIINKLSTNWTIDY